MITKEEGEQRCVVPFQCMYIITIERRKEKEKFNICTSVKTSLSVIKSQIPSFGRVTMHIVNI